MTDAVEFEIVRVPSGARSLRSRKFGETFHPVVGPMAEAAGLHVRQQRVIERARRAEGTFVVWDVGLGAAANAIAVIDALEEQPISGIRIELHSFDLNDRALRFAMDHGHELGYLDAHADAVVELLESRQTTGSNYQWNYHEGDFRSMLGAAPPPDAILYDPYSPAANPEMWALEHFTRLRSALAAERPCLLTNYTRSTAVRVTLLLAGFFVGRGFATGEKDETTVAATTLELLDTPLGNDWLERVRRSTNSAPLRAGIEARDRIAPEDWARLTAHPQFVGRKPEGSAE